MAFHKNTPVVVSSLIERGIVSHCLKNSSLALENPLKTLKRNSNNIVISFLNINSIRYKLEDVNQVILNNVDLLCIAESKLNSTFTNAQIKVQGFKTFRLDVSDKSGGLFFYAREHLSVRQLDFSMISPEIQCITTELNLRKQKWLILNTYRNPKQNIAYFLDEISKLLDFYSAEYENLLLLGDFNEEISHPYMSTFITSFSLHSLILKPTCFKSTRGRCIDLILTNKNRSFMKSNSFETGLSDYHELIYTMFKTSYIKLKPKIINYRSFRHFTVEEFRKDLIAKLSKTENSDFDDYMHGIRISHRCSCP